MINIKIIILLKKKTLYHYALLQLQAVIISYNNNLEYLL